MGWKTREKGSYPTRKKDIFFSNLFSPALGLYELPVQIRPRFLSVVVKRPERHTDSSSCVKVKNVKNYAALQAIHLNGWSSSERKTLSYRHS
jgi:hypothetical protein